ncbi:MAG: LL-diaminopimelate aminotransferase [bacterium]
MSFQPNLADRISYLPPYLFAEIDRFKTAAKKRGMNLIDLSIGDPDSSTPTAIVEELCEQAGNPKNQKYPSYQGLLKFREAASTWCYKRFGLNLDPEKEVLGLIGSKEGIGHIPFAFVNPSDYVLIPDPGYPVYYSSTILVGGNPYLLPLLKENNFLPDLSKIDQNVLKKAKLLFLNYPNNPTAAVASRDFFKEVVSFAHNHNLIVCHDAAYSEIYFDEDKPTSFLEIDGAKEIGIEFHSLSKTYNMTGWRIGFAVGNANLIAGLGKVKTNLDSGIFEPIQYAGIKALTGDQASIAKLNVIYKERRDVVVVGLKKLGLEVEQPKATFYVWSRLPKKWDSSIEFTKCLLNETGIVVTPGVGFGKSGEGYFRIALTLPKERLEEVVAIIDNYLGKI